MSEKNKDTGMAVTPTLQDRVKAGAYLVPELKTELDRKKQYGYVMILEFNQAETIIAALEAAATLRPGEGWPEEPPTEMIRAGLKEADETEIDWSSANKHWDYLEAAYKGMRNWIIATSASPVIPSAGGEVVVSPKLLEHLQICADSGANLSRDEVQELLDILSPARAAIAVIQEQKP